MALPDIAAGLLLAVLCGGPEPFARRYDKGLKKELETTDKNDMQMKLSGKRYPVRAVKYFCFIFVLFTVLEVLVAWRASGMLTAETMQAFLVPQLKRFLLPAALLSLGYPWFGFTTARVAGCDLDRHRTQLLNAMKANGMAPVREEDGVWLFRGATFGKRAAALFEDELRVRRSDEGGIEIEGVRRIAVRVAYRLEGYLHALRDDETPEAE